MAASTPVPAIIKHSIPFSPCHYPVFTPYSVRLSGSSSQSCAAVCLPRDCGDCELNPAIITLYYPHSHLQHVQKYSATMHIESQNSFRPPLTPRLYCATVL